LNSRRHLSIQLLYDFESSLGRLNLWSKWSERLSSRSFHPNGLQPEIAHRWQHESFTWIRDRFSSVLKSEDTTGNPLLVTRRGQCGLGYWLRSAAQWHRRLVAHPHRSPDALGSQVFS
jgi:hypothetical protein